jgi:hypothetical protein
MRGPVPAGRPCATCTFKQVPRVLPLGFPLPPFDLAEPSPRPLSWPEIYGVWPMPYPPFRLSGII